MTTDPHTTAIQRVAASCRVRRLRTMRQFAEQEIVHPSGPYQGERWKVERQPFAGLWFDAIDSAHRHGWRRFNLLGPSQAGKTQQGSAIPTLYHLFECRETVVYGVPTLDMAGDKWREDLLPLIQASAYRDLLPDSGGGSKGGTPTAIQFKNGATLRFMTAGGGDKVRAGFTSRVAVVTETDGFDEAGGSSRETDKLSQIEARTNAFGDRARVYLECTVSIEEGRTWQEHKQGTTSRIVLPCPHCAEWVTPDREHLQGWQDAQTVNEARDKSILACPKCGTGWTESERAAANRRGIIAHKDQAVEANGSIVGLLPPTQTFSLRFTTANNLFASINIAAAEEWTAQRQPDATLAEKRLRQFWWALPVESESLTLSELDVAAIVKRVSPTPRGRVPDGAEKLTIGIDIGKWLCHWVAVAWMPGGGPHIVEYGRLECASAAMGEDQAILAALRQFRDDIAAGWPSAGDKGNVRSSLTLVDSGDFGGPVISFTRESGPGYQPSKGFGAGQIGRRKLMHDPGWEIVPQPAGYVLVEVNSDHWKSFVHARLQTPKDEPGGLSLFHATAVDHLSFAKHLTAEKRVEEFEAGRGSVTKWEKINRNNHYLDALAYACAGGHAVGIRLLQSLKAEPTIRTESNSIPAAQFLGGGKRW